MEFVDADAILTAVGKPGLTDPDPDAVWAGQCADAVNAAIETALNGYDVVADSAAEAELIRCALVDGQGAYMDRDAPQGVLTVGPDGAPVRLRADVLRSCVPVIDRYAIPGIG